MKNFWVKLKFEFKILNFKLIRQKCLEILKD